MALVSIIVPVYNTEQYIHRCLDSIICQTYHKIEIILVDDGSTDRSAQICDEYESKDTRIKVFHQENQGSALSRKFAFGESVGDYILMVDSDDWVEPTMVEKMLSLAITQELDVVWCDVILQNQLSQSIHHIKFNNDPQKMLKSIYRGDVPGWLWNKLIRRNLWEDMIAYKDNVLEDVFFSTQILLKNPRMGYIAEPLYQYNLANSAALTAHEGVFVRGIPNIMHCFDYLNQYQYYEVYKDSLSTLILKAKIELMKNHRYRDAQFFYPFAHLYIKKYPIKLPFSIVYWLGLNMGVLGRLLLKIYFFFVGISHLSRLLR